MITASGKCQMAGRKYKTAGVTESMILHAQPMP
jgi:hypothetical protein